jgi:hypothetical protein
MFTLECANVGMFFKRSGIMTAVLLKPKEQSFADVYRQIELIDLEKVKKKLMSAVRHGGQEWDEDLTEEAVDFYRKFLTLCTFYKGLKFVPTGDIDTVWHQHILDTKKYQNDCKEYLGFFLHHNPNYSPETAGDKYKESSIKTVELFVEHFGHRPKGEHMLCSDFPCDSGECSS